MSADRLRLGVLTQPFGREGAMRCHTDAFGITKILAPCPAWVGYSESFSEQMQLLSCVAHGKDLICQFEGVATRGAAEALSDRAIYLRRESIRYADIYSDPVVIGYEARDERDGELGAIASIFRTQAHAVWTIRQGETETMIPAIAQFVTEINHARRRVIIRPIPGMFDDDDTDESGTEGTTRAASAD